MRYIMSEMKIRVPEYLQRQAETLAQKEKTSLDHVVSLALANHLTARLETNYLEELAARAGWEQFKTVFYSRPQVEPHQSAAH